MTIEEYLEALSDDDMAYVKKYYDGIQPFEVLLSSTFEFDGVFSDRDGEPIRAEINLSDELEIEDMFCTCGAGGCCVHLAAMMYDMTERGTIFLSRFFSKMEIPFEE